MLRRSFAAGTLAGALALGMVAAPAIAKKPDNPGGKSKAKGTTSVMFTKSVKRKLRVNDIDVSAVAPARKKGKVKVVLPAQQTETAITHTGAIVFSHGDATLTLSDLVFDLEAGNVDVTVPGVGEVSDALDLSRLKVKRKVTLARLMVAEGKADLLNQALDTEMFRDGMFLAKANTKR